MQYLRGIEFYRNDRPSAITLGKFDGLHLGHELLVERVAKHQEKDGVDGIVLAFDMSPLYQKLKIEPDFLLTGAEKAKRLDGRVSYFIDCPFDEAISGMQAEEFVGKILVNQFHAKYVVVGDDFRFGYQKQGDCRMLEECGGKYGFQVEVIPKKMYRGREISSTYIKEELKKGNIELVNVLLGYDYLRIKEKTFDNR